ncbi:MbtH family protein [Streptomyces albidoflavus]|uniref:MbtH family protein n=1 Tax=Streptomyces albidoflavus TaxID=1886 RepID=UPI0034104883
MTAVPENPFESSDGTFLVLVNQENQHSLWPAKITVPDGWEKVYEGGKSACVDYVDREWTDLRPASLARALDSGAAQAAE